MRLGWLWLNTNIYLENVCVMSFSKVTFTYQNSLDTFHSSEAVIESVLNSVLAAYIDYEIWKPVMVEEISLKCHLALDLNSKCE